MICSASANWQIPNFIAFDQIKYQKFQQEKISRNNFKWKKFQQFLTTSEKKCQNRFHQAPSMANYLKTNLDV